MQRATRYILCLFPLFIIYITTLLSKSNPTKPYLTAIFVALSSIFCIFQNYRPGGIGDVELSYLPALKVQQQLVKYFEEKQYYRTPIYAPFLDNNNLGQPLSGFRTTGNVFERIHGHFTPGSDSILIFNNIEKDLQKDSILLKGNYKLERVFEEDMVRSEVYKYLGAGKN